uniref:Uncharacterized protein n=1 Tax=Rhizophora mucronata TaxID=61149 RepID=A0A2P2NT68_RHIMU
MNIYQNGNVTKLAKLSLDGVYSDCGVMSI